MTGNPYFKHDQVESLTRVNKKKIGKIKLKEEFKDLPIILSQVGDNFVAAFEGSEGKFARGSTKSMAIGNLILQNSEPVD